MYLLWIVAVRIYDGKMEFMINWWFFFFHSPQNNHTESKWVPDSTFSGGLGLSFNPFTPSCLVWFKQIPMCLAVWAVWAGVKLSGVDWTTGPGPLANEDLCLLPSKLVQFANRLLKDKLLLGRFHTCSLVHLSINGSKLLTIHHQHIANTVTVQIQEIKLA